LEAAFGCLFTFLVYLIIYFVHQYTSIFENIFDDAVNRGVWKTAIHQKLLIVKLMQHNIIQ